MMNLNMWNIADAVPIDVIDFFISKEITDIT